MKNIIGISALLSALLASFCSVAPSFAQSGCVHTGYFGQLSSWNSSFSLNGESAAYVSGPCNPSTRRCQTVEVQRAGADAVFGTTDDSSEYMFFQLPFDVYEVQLLDASRLAVSTAFDTRIINAGVDGVFGTTDDTAAGLGGPTDRMSLGDNGVLTLQRFDTLTLRHEVKYCDSLLAAGLGSCTAGNLYQANPNLTGSTALDNILGFRFGSLIGVSFSQYFSNYNFVQTEASIDGSPFINVIPVTPVFGPQSIRPHVFTDHFNGFSLLIRLNPPSTAEIFLTAMPNVLQPVASVFSFTNSGMELMQQPRIDANSMRVVVGVQQSSSGAQALLSKNVLSSAFAVTPLGANFMGSEHLVSGNRQGDTLVLFVTAAGQVRTLAAYQCN